MYILRTPYCIPPQLAAGCVVTLGNFDGVHKGHQSLIGRAKAKADEAGLPVVVVTFDPHPLQVMKGKDALPMLMSLEGKLACLQNLGVNATIIIPFNKQFAQQTPQEFVTSFLINTLHVKHLVIGYDYAFGKGRAGNAAMLTEMGSQHGFTVEQVAAYQEADSIVSSTVIRDLLMAGQVEQARAMLGRPHFVQGEVVHGKNRGGKLLGFPTAHLQQNAQLLLPQPGVYTVCAEVFTKGDHQELIYPMQYPPLLQGVASVGSNPTFNDAFERVETYLFDFDKDIYGLTMRVHFMHRLREEVTFSGVDALVAQITKDCQTARQMLGSGPCC